MPTLNAAAGDLSLVLPKRILDGIIEMIYALDKVAPGTANDDTLLYGVEVKFYNMEVEVDSNLMTCHDGLYIIGDGSGITHSLSHASASGVHVARQGSLSKNFVNNTKRGFAFQQAQIFFYVLAVKRLLAFRIIIVIYQLIP